MSQPWSPARFAGLLSLCILAFETSCAKELGSAAPEVRRETSVPARGTTLSCADTRRAYVCWNDVGAPVSAVAPPLPTSPSSPLGYRCHGMARERVCADRALDATPFTCTGARCVQEHPRFPDDGEWECSDAAGAMLCRGGERPAGVAPGGRPGGFWCGVRRIRGAETKERVCVDFSPDFPPEGTQPFACRFEGTRRVCEAQDDVHSLGDACDAAHPCVDGAVCVSARCVPGVPSPACWLDSDCDNGACRFGSCWGDRR